MNTLDAITTRRSIRRFLEKPVENEQIEAVVTAASFAPSWKNTQTARYIAITDPVAKETIAAEMLPSSNAATARSASHRYFETFAARANARAACAAPRMGAAH